MPKKQRLRRIVILCLHCIRNCAFYKARKPNLLSIDHDESEFWRSVDGNFLDICVLEWCKLFADDKGKHSWKKVVTNQQMFLGDLYAALKCTEIEFNDYKSKVKHYRDKFIAHLDNENTMNIPNLDWIKGSVLHLYDYLIEHEQVNNFLAGIPNIHNLYKENINEAIAAYGKIK